MTISDQRRTDFYIVDNAVIDQYGAKLGPNGLAVYNVLLRIAGDKSECWPAIDTLAERLGISPPTVRKALQTLTETGLIAATERFTDGKQTSNSYILLTLRKADQPAPVVQPLSGSLYDRTIARVEAAEGRSKLGVLLALWREIFGVETDYAAVQKLLTLVNGDAVAVAKALIKVVGYHGLVTNPSASVYRELMYQSKAATKAAPRSKPTAQPSYINPDKYQATNLELDE